MPGGTLPDEGFVWLLTQGVLGFTTSVGMFVAAYMYRKREEDRIRYERTMAAKDEAHDIEMAQWIKLTQDIRGEQLNDQRIQNERLASNTDLIRQLWQAKGGRFEQAS